MADPADVRVLVVDDDPSIRDLLTAQLTDEGHDVSAAIDGESARDDLSSTSYDALVLDVMMPGMTGWELLTWVRGEGGLDTPVVLLTARDVADDVRRGYELGANAVMSKPYDFADLRRELARVTTELELVDDSIVLPADPARVPAPFPGRWAADPRESGTVGG